MAKTAVAEACLSSDVSCKQMSIASCLQTLSLKAPRNWATAIPQNAESPQSEYVGCGLSVIVVVEISWIGIRPKHLLGRQRRLWGDRARKQLVLFGRKLFDDLGDHSNWDERSLFRPARTDIDLDFPFENGADDRRGR